MRIAERKNRSLVKKTRCLLIQSGLSKEFWAEAIATINYLKNRCPSKGLNGCIPLKVFYNFFLMCRFREFGSKVFVLNKNKKEDKFELKSVDGTMVGYSEESTDYRI